MKFRLDTDPLPDGVTVVTGDNGECTVTIDPIVAFGLHGSKAKLVAARKDLAGLREDRSKQTRVLMELTLALSSLLESADRLQAAQETDEGRDVIGAFLAMSSDAARRAISQVGDAQIDWVQVLSGRVEDTPPPAGVWARMIAELEPMVTGPEGAALILTLRELSEIEGSEPGYGDALYALYAVIVQAAGAARALMIKEPAEHVFARPIYKGLVNLALSLIRHSSARQLAAFEAAVKNLPPDHTGEPEA